MKVIVGGYKFEVRDKDEHIQKHWLKGGFYEANRNGMLSYMLHDKNFYKGKTVLDVGACIGNHTVFFEKKLGMNVIAFEPHRTNFEHLQVNCELNGCKAELHNVALGEKKGLISMVGPKDNVGMMKVTEGKTVKMDLLDNLVERADVVKIDVEGYNKHVLKGADRLLKSKCIWFIECDNDQVLKETDEIMTSYGYKRANIVLNHTPTYLFL